MEGHWIWHVSNSNQSAVEATMRKDHVPKGCTGLGGGRKASAPCQWVVLKTPKSNRQWIMNSLRDAAEVAIKLSNQFRENMEAKPQKSKISDIWTGNDVRTLLGANHWILLYAECTQSWAGGDCLADGGWCQWADSIGGTWNIETKWMGTQGVENSITDLTKKIVIVHEAYKEESFVRFPSWGEMVPLSWFESRRLIERQWQSEKR